MSVCPNKNSKTIFVTGCNSIEVEVDMMGSQTETLRKKDAALLVSFIRVHVTGSKCLTAVDGHVANTNYKCPLKETNEDLYMVLT